MKIRPTWHFDGTFTLKVGGLHHADYEFTTSMSKEEEGALIAELEVTLRESSENLFQERSELRERLGLVDYQVLDDWSDRIEEGGNHAV